MTNSDKCWQYVYAVKNKYGKPEYIVLENECSDEIRTGHWIPWDEVVAGHYHEVSECSECGFTTEDMSREEMKSCPRCGARMKETE